MKSTLEETRTERFIGMADRGLMPVPLRYYGAHTGRWSGSDKINLQNITRGSPLNTAITAPDGHVIINCDSSQIEARVLAWLAGQEDLVAAFDRGDDVYKIMASSIYNKPVDAIDKDERFLGKTVVLGAGYGTGWLTFQKQLKLKGVTVTDDTAQSIIQTYRETYPRIPLLWKEAGNALDAILDDDKTAPLGTEGALVVEGDKGVRLPNGLYIRYPNLRWENTKGRVEMVYDTKRGRSTIMTRIHGPKMVENVTQALARIIIGDQLLMVARRYRVALTVHDSIVAIAPASEEAKAVEYITNCMRVRPKWAPTLPLSCEAKTGANYG